MSTDMGTFIPLTEMFFRGAPEWTTLLVSTFADSYFWLDTNISGSEIKCCNVGGVGHHTASIHHGWHEATVIAKREVQKMTKEQRRANLLAQLAALDDPTPIGNLLKYATTLPDLLEARMLAAWVAQEAPDWDGSKPVGVYNSGGWDTERGDLLAIGGIKMPIRLAELLCEKLNSKEWTL